MDMTPEFRTGLADGLKSLAYVEYEKQRKSRASRNFGRMLAKQRPKMQRVVNEMLNDMNKSILKGVSRMKGRTATQKVNSLTDWKLLEKNAKATISPALMEALVAGGNAVLERKIVKQERFDPLGAEAVKWIETHGAELVGVITKETRKALVAAVSEGIKQGMGTAELGRLIRPIVGLQKRQATALIKARAKMIADGLSTQVIESRTARMAGKMHRYRATLIARTESAAGLNEGIRQGYGQTGVKKLERVESGDSPDEDCMVNNGRIYTLAEAQGVLPSHPACQGSWVAA